MNKTNATMIEKGIFLCSHTKRGYVWAAYNAAVSAKHHCPDIHVTLFTDGIFDTELLDWQKSIFDKVIRIPDEIKFKNGLFDPANIKISAFDFFPYKYTLFIDVDMFAMGNVNKIFDELIADGKYYYSHIIGEHKLEQGRDIPHMYWAYADDIWNHYNLPADAILPSTNSSFQFIKMCDESRELFSKIRANFENPIPISKLRNQWGGTQPDELYLNIALAQMGLVPRTPRTYLWMSNQNTSNPLSYIYENFELLCLFGQKERIKPLYTSWMDRELIEMHSKMGKQHFYKWHKIVGDKHANQKIDPIHQSVYRDDILVPQNLPGKVNLYVPFFVDKNELRNNELRFCLATNEQIKTIDKIYLITDAPVELPNGKAENVHVVYIDHRQQFIDMVNEANKHADDNTISIIANCDIYFDERSIQLIKSINFKKYALALSRWDIQPGGKAKHFSYEWSQDCWAWTGKLDVEKMNLNFEFGKMGCDNRFAFELSKQKSVINPSYSIKTYHKHESGVRNYTTSDRLDGDYLPIKPETAHTYIKKRLLLIQPGKVGDIILCLPIAKYYSSEYIVEWLCPKKYHSIFSSIDYVRPVETQSIKYERIIDIAFGLGGAPEKHWQQHKHEYDSFVTLKYELAGVPITEKPNLMWTRNEKRENELFDLVCSKFNGEPFVLVHESSDYGTPIHVDKNNRVEFKPIDDFTIFDWYKVIVMASEIHCIDSSLCNFVDAIPEVANTKKHWYKTDKVPNKWDETILTNNWNKHTQQTQTT